MKTLLMTNGGYRFDKEVQWFLKEHITSILALCDIVCLYFTIWCSSLHVLYPYHGQKQGTIVFL